MTLDCHHRFAAHDGLDVRVMVVWPLMSKYAMCAGCRRAAQDLGLDIREEWVPEWRKRLTARDETGRISTGRPAA